MRRTLRFLPVLLGLSTSTYLYCHQEGFSLYAWGSGRNGELGLGVQTNVPLPTLLRNMKFVDISARKACSAAITADGKLYTWGNARNGVLGYDSSNLNILMPKEVPLPQSFKQVSCGYQHTCAVTSKGEVYIWGNVNDSAGMFRSIGTKETQRKLPERHARKVINLSDIQEVACSGEHTVARSSTGLVYTWGNKKRIGREGSQSEPHLVPLERIVKIACGIDFTLVLDDSGRIYSWGNNTFGQLGIPSAKSINLPKQIESLAHEEIVDISCGDNFAGAISRSGKVYTWGFGNEGQLGHGDKTDQNIPRPLNFEQVAKQIACGGAHTAILTQSNELYIFGRGRQGQIGHEQKDQSSTAYRLKPRLVQALHKLVVRRVVCGGHHTLALVE